MDTTSDEEVTERSFLGKKMDLRHLTWGPPGLRVKLASFVVLATATVLAISTYGILRFQHDQMLAAAMESSSTTSDVLRVVLEEQMVVGDRTILRHLVVDLGKEPNVQWVGLLDPKGQVKVSSDSTADGRVFALSSADCQICHAHAPQERHRSVTLVRPEGGVLRTVTPLMNRPVCHRCHGPAQRINGVLIVDRSLQPVESAAMASQKQLFFAGIAGLVALIGSLGVGLEWLVLMRIRRLRKATQELGRGSQRKLVADRSEDELGDLSRDFNNMADRLVSAVAGLASERQQLAELVNGIADGVVLVDRDMRVVLTNRAFADRLPAAYKASRGDDHWERARAAGFATAGEQSPARRALSTGILQKEIVRSGPHGEERFDEVYAQPLRGPDGVMVGAIEVWRDITDRKALEAGLEQSERLATLGMLASSVAHEVGNPLASMATAVEGLLLRLDESEGLDLEELRQYLTIVRQQVFRCHGVTERLLGFARVPPGRPAVVDAAAKAREVVALVTPQARLQGVEVHASLDDPAFVLAEKLLLEQVFLNLVMNALKVMPHGGALRVEAHRDAGNVCVVVQDTGPGVPETVLRHLFEPFRRGQTEGMGTGLGLFISHTLVQRCGGTIGVVSEMGRGSSFTVRLRAAPESRIEADLGAEGEIQDASSDRR